jgi:hypothetical protein
MKLDRIIRDLPLKARMTMRVEKIICDGCEKEFDNDMPMFSVHDADLRQGDGLLDREYHFCGFFCLSSWSTRRASKSKSD